MTKRKTHILIIDNEKEFSFFTSANLEAAGYRVTAARDGYNGFHIAAENHPDLILLDILMPAMNGFQILEKLKGDPATRPIPVIMISALHDEDRIRKARELGAADFVCKPFLIASLIEAIEAARKPLS